MTNENNMQFWKDGFVTNSEMMSYGNGMAEIIDYGIFDLDNNCQATINNEDEYVIKMKVKFNEEIDEPIFALSIKDFKGLELGGCNTRSYKVITGTYKKGDVVTVEFRQTFPLAPERYTISFGCTKINSNGELEVFDRKYDALFLEIIANRDCLGVIDLKSDITIKK
jgi:teichoic acid transport system ATP-binding protein